VTVRFLLGMLSVAALALGLLAGTSLGTWFAAAGEQAAARPVDKRTPMTISNPAVKPQPPLATPISHRG
jgi:hypothetical protein